MNKIYLDRYIVHTQHLFFSLSLSFHCSLFPLPWGKNMESTSRIIFILLLNMLHKLNMGWKDVISHIFDLLKFTCANIIASICYWICKYHNKLNKIDADIWWNNGKKCFICKSLNNDIAVSIFRCCFFFAFLLWWKRNRIVFIFGNSNWEYWALTWAWPFW